METKVELADVLHQALETSDLSAWKGGVRRPGADALRALNNDHALCEAICNGAGFENFNHWILAAPRWIDSLHRPGASSNTQSEILRIAWEAVTDQVMVALHEARRKSERLPLGGVPAEGGVLAFVDGLELCLVMRYRFVSDLPELSVIATIPHPRSVFDIVDDLIRRDHPTKNELKQILQSSHKLVWHRGILGHVDRQFEQTVFGPSIDTLYVAEVLARRFGLHVGGETVRNVLEVGTGSGFLLAGLMRNVEPECLLGIDSDAGATACTARNVAINMPEPTTWDGAPPAVMLSPFREELLAMPFDLVVCNPPYIPEPPGRTPTTLGHRGSAVAGLDLIDSLLEAAPRLLSDPNGEMLLLVSSVTPPSYVEDRLPDGFESCSDSNVTQGRSVLFEVEEIFDLPVHLKFLETSGGIRREGSNYMHDLHALWIHRSRQRAA